MTESPRRAATREKLIDAAITVFAAKGVLGATVEEICEAAGFTRGAFYSNFASRDDLYLAVTDSIFDDMRDKTQAALSVIDSSDPRGETIDKAGRALCDALGDDPRIVVVTIVLRLHALRTPALRQAYVDQQIRVAQSYAPMLVATLAKAGLAFTVPVADAMAILQGVHEQASIESVLYGGRPNDDTVAKRLAAGVRALVAPITTEQLAELQQMMAALADNPRAS